MRLIAASSLESLPLTRLAKSALPKVATMARSRRTVFGANNMAPTYWKVAQIQPFEIMIIRSDAMMVANALVGNVKCSLGCSNHTTRANHVLGYFKYEYPTYQSLPKDEF